MRRFMASRVMMALMIAAGGTAISAAPAFAESTEIKVISHNIKGGQDNNGALNTLNLVKSNITSFGPDVVMLQEVCRSQADNFYNTYAPQGWSIYYVERRNHPDCDGVPGGAAAAIGELIAVPSGGAPAWSLPLAGDGSSSNYRMSCLFFQKNGAREYMVCNTHLSSGDSNGGVRDTQIAQIRNELQWSIDNGRGVVVGGDFNTTPDNNSMDKMYKIRNDGSQTGGGLFYEADQSDTAYFRPACLSPTRPFCRSGQVTVPASSRKLDYVWFAANKTSASSVQGVVVGSSLSNHSLYRARGTFVW